MITKVLNQNNSDITGAMASGLCLIHCIATPFIFIAQSCSATCCDSSPFWWQSIDYIFIGVSFFAVYWSVKHTLKRWMKSALWISWLALSFVIINEKIELAYLPESLIYLPALGLVGLHIYNKKYCRCKDDKCCSSSINI